MKLYNIHPYKKTFSWGEMYVISLGEEGRGRRLTLVPFQGDITNLEAENFQVGLTKKGFPKIITGQKSDGYIALLSGEGVYTRGTYGSVKIYSEDKDKIKIIAYGKGAYGIAGRIGEWYEFMVVVNPLYPVRFYVQPAGGEHKRERYYLVFLKDRVIEIKKEELNLFQEESGIDLTGEYIDLIELV